LIDKKKYNPLYYKNSKKRYQNLAEYLKNSLLQNVFFLLKHFQQYSLTSEIFDRYPEFKNDKLHLKFTFFLKIYFKGM